MEIKHDLVNKKFFTLVGGKEARISYREVGNKQLEFYTTFVPPEGRGHGVAAQLTEAALAYAREQGKDVIPTCSYVAAYIKSRK